MKATEIIKREMAVAFSKNAQPVWFRLLKYILIGSTLYFFWRSKLFWIIAGIAAMLSVCLHFWYRHKTHGWTKSYGMWKPDEADKDHKEMQISGMTTEYSCAR